MVVVPELSGLHAAGTAGDAAARERVTLLLESDGLAVVFQPVKDLATGQVVGHEALARFPDGRSPDVWFAEADGVGLGVELELLAITTAVRAMPAEVPGSLGVNVSPATMASPRLRHALHDVGLVRRLVLETTERQASAEHDLTVEGIASMRDAGVLVALDETGSSASLRRLVELGADVLKIDRSLVSNVDTDTSRRAVVAGLTATARTLGWEVVAVGIERIEEVDTCRELGIDLGQGYLLGRPAPLSAAEASSAASWVALSEEIWQAGLD